MKNRVTKPYVGPERVAYITFQTHKPLKVRTSRREARQPGPGGYMLVGMGESLSKTFTTHEAAAKWALGHGYKVKVTRGLVATRARLALALAVALLTADADV